MSIKRLLDVVERRGDIRWRVVALVLPISDRPGMTSSCASKIGLREASEHTRGTNLASRDNIAHNPTLYTNPLAMSASLRSRTNYCVAAIRRFVSMLLKKDFEGVSEQH